MSAEAFLPACPPGTRRGAAVLVVKFGGTSLGTPARIRRAARRVAALVASGRSVVAVVSAMGHTTDRILGALGALGEGASPREVDRALATGEDLSAALLAAALCATGVPARSLRGGEAGVRAAGPFGGARVARVDARPLRRLLARGVVPVVSGFQGARDDAETATLGRGGSDTSAVAIAAALGPAPCDIVTDVDAVYDRDPRSSKRARRLERLSHDELLALARDGAQVVHLEAARLAREANVPLRVLAFDAPPGRRDERHLRRGAAVSRAEVRPLGSFELESGETLHDVRAAYRLDGALDPGRTNVVLVLHSLTGSPADLGGWDALAGPGAPLDTRRFAVLAPNLLGSCYGTTFRRTRGSGRGAPAIGTRDQARLAGALLDALGIRRVALAVGGSLGGMVALEWAATFPDRAAAAVAVAAPAGPCAWGAAWNHVHRRAVEAAGPRGLALARMVGMLTYRTAAEVESRFRDGGGTHPVRAYLDHHGDKLAQRFSRRSYLALLEAMDAHDVGRGRGGVGAALARFRGRLTGVGIAGDLLYTPDEVRSWTRAAGAVYREIASTHGHDAFLLEREAVGRILAEAAGAALGGDPDLTYRPPVPRILSGAGPRPRELACPETAR